MKFFYHLSRKHRDRAACGWGQGHLIFGTTLLHRDWCLQAFSITADPKEKKIREQFMLSVISKIYLKKRRGR
jgi:hypothetical protein